MDEHPVIETMERAGVCRAQYADLAERWGERFAEHVVQVFAEDGGGLTLGATIDFCICETCGAPYPHGCGLGRKDGTGEFCSFACRDEDMVA